MNRWHVFIYLKQFYTASGELLSEELIKIRFPYIPPEEVAEGFAEFLFQLK